MLTAYAGSMAAGKTRALVNIANYYENCVVAIKPIVSDRGEGASILQARDGSAFRPCIPVDPLAPDSFLQAVGDKPVIVIDEFQFFGFDIPLNGGEAIFQQEVADEYVKVVRRLHEDGRKVHVGGLVQFTNGDLFGNFHKILGLADDIKYFKATCSYCKQPDKGTRTIPSYNSGGKPVLRVGGSDSYAPSCCECWLSWLHGHATRP